LPTGDDVTLLNPTNLTTVWVRTLADGLVRADQIIGIESHPTPAVGGKPSRWLLDVIVPTVSGGGATTHSTGDWSLTPLHRTLAQSAQEPREAPTALARLLAQLATTAAAGIITAHTHTPRPPTRTETTRHDTSAHRTDHRTAPDAAYDTHDTVDPAIVRFRFTPFAEAEPARQTDTEYLQL
jgi:hypothetical protein